MVTYTDMRCPWFKDINPNQKVPAIVIPNGSGQDVLYESNVIYEYLVDSYGVPPNLAPGVPFFQHRDLSAIHRAKVNLMCRVHDMYVASPNCNQPGCTHSQGALYLPPPGDKTVDPTEGRRAIDITTRSRKITELWTRWRWLEELSSSLGDSPYLAGNHLSMADTTWFPTAVFMEFLLKHVADWPTLFADYHAESGETADFKAPKAVYGEWVDTETWNPGPVDSKMLHRFPKLTAWYPELLKIADFRRVREEIMGFWLNERHLDGLQPQPNNRVKRFDPILAAIKEDGKSLAWKPVVKGESLEWPSEASM